MPYLINSGRKNFCKSSQGGIKKVYLAGFVPYTRNEFGFDNLVLAYIPTTYVYEFELIGNNNTFSNSYNGESYTQSLNVEFRKQGLQTTKQMESLNYMELRALILDNNGNYLVFGLDNGITSSSLEIVTGGSKGEFNGYRLQFSGMEKHTSPLVLNPFEIGFVLAEENADFYQFQDLSTFLFQDGAPYYFN
tara:strand:+ start:325 stop:897 length:573 start_codon:yes stop_codon:yes gene_type:complete